MKMKIINLIILLQTILLTACSSLNSSFDCPMKPGVRCENLDQVNAQVDHGELGASNINTTSQHPSVQDMMNDKSPSSYKEVGYLQKGEPLRYDETVMRVWIAPYEDLSGNYHQESDIYSVVKPGHWIGYPPKKSSEG